MIYAQHPALAEYYSRLEGVKIQGFKNESQTQRAFAVLLDQLSRERGWTFVAETPLDGAGKGRKVDGSIRDELRISRGHWEAKDEKDDLDAEIKWKRSIGYPTDNIIFEDTRRAVLFQNKREVARFDITQKVELSQLLEQFFDHTEEDRAGFDAAVRDFAPKIPDLARALKETIAPQYEKNPQYRAAFDGFFALCQNSLNPQIKREVVEEMLIQHLLTERLFRSVFSYAEWASRNAIAGEIEVVIRALAFSRDSFLKRLDPFYKAIEQTGKTIELWSDKQAFLNTVYERFFQGYSAQTADTMGIVYTPQPIVDWMVNSVELILSREWGKSLSTQGVHVLDPCTGTGNFLVNVLGKIDALDIERKFKNELWANEIMLLPYYIAAGNIEHEYIERTGHFEPFPGLCFADTLSLFQGEQLSIKEFDKENAERLEREMAAPITVIIGNPPYNVGQKNENDNNKNRPYPKLDAAIKSSYAKASRATNKNALYDPYARFFRWASERLNGQDGVICFVSNNSFLDQHAFDGMRAILGEQFNHIWHLDLHGNVRQNPKLSGTTHNVFGIQVGVGITILVRNHSSKQRFIRFHRVQADWRKIEKLDWLKETVDCGGVEWETLTPNAKNAWLTAGLQEDFESFLPLGNKESKASFSPDIQTVFRSYGRGVATCRDDWAYDFQRETLAEDIKRFTEVYNSEVERWQKSDRKTSIDDFVSNDSTRIKWSESLKAYLKRGSYGSFDENKIRPALYRPFTKQFIYFDSLLNERTYQMPRAFPLQKSENRVMCLTAPGNQGKFHVLMTNCIADLHLTGDSQCFPFFTYTSDGENQSENITSYALSQFREKYGAGVTKWDIFHYVYALLHHPSYRARYAENLKRDLPRVPLWDVGFEDVVRIGRELGELHVGYESAPELSTLQLHETREKGKPLSFRIEKMKWNADKTQLRLNSQLSLSGFTPDLFDYKLGNRAALDWIVESYRVKSDERSGLVSDPNRADEPQYIVRLVRRVAFVARETKRLVEELAGVSS